MRGHNLRAANGKPALSFIGSATWNTATSVSPLTVAFGSSAIAGVQAGDLLIVAVSDDLTGTLSALTSGWSTAFADTGFDSSSTAALYYRLTSGSNTTFNLTTSGTAVEPVAVMMAFRNATYLSHSNSAIDTVVCPTVTIPYGGAAVIAGFCQDDATVMTAPTNYTSGFAQAVSNVSAGNISSVGMGYRKDIMGSQSPGSFGGVGGATNFMRCTSIVLQRG